jgi:hypothetical protein
MINKSNCLLDSRASVHVTNSFALLKNAKKTKQAVKVGNGENAQATMIGEVDIIVEGNKRLRLKGVLFVLGFIRNVISLSKIVSNGVTVELHDGFVKFLIGNIVLQLQKTSKDSMRTIESKIENGIPTAMVLEGQDKATLIENNEATLPKAKKTPTMNIMEAHETLGHPNKRTTRMTMEEFGWKVVGEMEPCNGCLQFKAKAKGVSHKPTKTQATESGERLFLDRRN